MNKTKEKSTARALQKETGWTYSECLRLTRIALADGTTIDEVLAREGRSRTPRTS